MLDLKNKSILVADNGFYLDLAPRLAREFGQVQLFIPWTSAYPRAAQAYVGCGIPGVERVPTFWDHVADADVVMFPDLYFADWQDVVADRFGKPVWGLRGAERLELDRWGTRKLQRRLGVGAPRTKYFVGVDDLAEYLEGVEDKWVKISCYRGDGETWHHETWHTTEVYLNHFRNRVGALASTYEFIVEDDVADAIELGYDGYCVRGEWPDAAYWGLEVKARAYVGRLSKYGDLPAPIRELNGKMSPVLKEEAATGFCCFEFMYTKDGRALMTDPCVRCGSPSIWAAMEGYANLGEIVWEGAHGRVSPVQTSGNYVAAAMMSSQFALENWVPLEIPESVERWVKLHNRAVIDGKTYYVPLSWDITGIGAVVAVADTLEEAIRLVKERAALVKGCRVDVDTDALDSAQEEIARAEEYGINFGRPSAALATDEGGREHKGKGVGGGQFTGKGGGGLDDIISGKRKPTSDEYADLLDQGYEWTGDGFIKLDAEQQTPVSRDVPLVVHTAARQQLYPEERALIGYAADWEQSKPWNMALEQLQTDPPPGFALTRNPRSEAAHYQGGKIFLSPKFFQDPALRDEHSRRHVIYHELGHLLADTMIKDGTSFQLHDAGVIPEQHDLGSGTGGGHGDEEALADTFAILHTDPKWLGEHYPEMATIVKDRAAALGMPLPMSVSHY